MINPVIHSNDSWTRLEEVWLGDVYPHEFYDHLAPDVRDVFYRLTDLTRQDLDIIADCLREFGVQVRRPVYRSIDDHVDAHGNLAKPEITPRDYYVVVGNQLILPERVRWQRHHAWWPWQQAVVDYEQDPRSQVTYQNIDIYLGGANVVRVGKDLFVDCVFVSENRPDLDRRQVFDQQIAPMFSDRRCHYLDNGGHIDACFAIIRPGLILANHYFQDYETTFPGWELIVLDRPEFRNHKKRSGPWSNGQWYLPNNLGNRAFNEHIIRHARDWIGDYTETFFEVNCLVIDEKNVLLLGDNDGVVRKLAQLGVTAHSLPFRCRTFWDGGLHCLTVDIRRQGQILDYFAQ